MRNQLELLEYLVRAWDIHGKCFRIGAHTLKIEVENIYFLVDLSRKGAPISFSGMRRGCETLKDYIATHYRPCSQPKKVGEIEIKDVTQLPLRTILFIIFRLASNSNFHLVNKSQMQYELECIKPIVFTLSEVVLEKLKEKNIREKYG